MLKPGSKTRDTCLIGLFAAITIVCSQISIALPYGVPMTLQTLAVPLAGVLLGARNGALSAFVYILLGAAGLPVFAGMSGGLAALFGQTGGFLLSFPLMAYISGVLAGKGGKVRLIVGVVLSMAVNYICGLLYFSVYTGSGLQSAFMACVLPFLPADVIKAALCYGLSAALRKAMAKGRA